MKKVSTSTLTMAAMLVAAAAITLYAAVSRPEPAAQANKERGACPIGTGGSACMPIGPTAATDEGDKASKAVGDDPAIRPVPAEKATSEGL